MRPTREETFLAIAAVMAARGTCLRRQVGCVLVDTRGHVLSTGYNGRAAGLPHCNAEVFVSGNVVRIPGVEIRTGLDGVRFIFGHACQGSDAASGTNLDACEALHAEQNALLQCRDVFAIDTAYVTVSPCITCAKLFMNTSCKRIIFSTPYAHDEAAKKLWLSVAGNKWVHYSELQVSR